MFQFVAYTPDPDAQEHVANVQTKGFIDLYWGGGRDGPPSIDRNWRAMGTTCPVSIYTGGVAGTARPVSL